MFKFSVIYNYIKKLLYGTAVLLMAMSLLACGSITPTDVTIEEIPIDFKLDLYAGIKMNPSTIGGSSPVSISIYELKSVDSFYISDYLDIINVETAPMDSLLKKDINKIYESILKPGDVKTIEISPDKGIIAIAIVAAYREINQAEWKKVYTLPERKKRPWYKKMWPKGKRELKVLEVRFDHLSISIKEMD